MGCSVQSRPSSSSLSSSYEEARKGTRTCNECKGEFLLNEATTCMLAYFSKAIMVTTLNVWSFQIELHLESPKAHSLGNKI